MRRPAWLVALVSAAMGCSGDAAPGDDFVDYSSTGGFAGNGEGVTLHIEQTGRMTQTVLSSPSTTRTLDSSAMNELRAEVDAARFPQLEHEYATHDPDTLGFIVTVQLPGGTYTVLTDLQAPAPRELNALVTHLRDMSMPFSE